MAEMRLMVMVCSATRSYSAQCGIGFLAMLALNGPMDHDGITNDPGCDPGCLHDKRNVIQFRTGNVIQFRTDFVKFHLSCLYLGIAQKSISLGEGRRKPSMYLSPFITTCIYEQRRTPSYFLDHSLRF